MTTAKLPHGRVNDFSCFNEYGHKYINLLVESIKSGSAAKAIEYCGKLYNHGSYENEAMAEALPLSQELGNSEVITAVTENCGYYAQNVTTGNYTVPVYPTTISGELSITSCDQFSSQQEL